MKTSGKLHSVHFMRFVAALAVVAHHLTTGLGNKHVLVGAAGVDVFFVISGIVIGMSMLRAEAPYDFAMKRLVRVMPLYWIATAASALFAFFAWSISPPMQEIVRSAFLWPRFGTEWHPLYYPAWSLEYEMLFYVVATVSIAVAGKHALPSCLLFMLMLSVIPVPVPFSHGDAHFETGMYLEFCAGLVTSCVLQQLIAIDRKTASMMVATAIMIFTINYEPNSVPRYLQWGAPSALLIAGLLAFDKEPLFSGKWATLGGDASYALYLTHITTLQALSYTAERLGMPFMNRSVTAVLIGIPACVVVAILVHLAIEKPTLSLLRKLLLRQIAPAKLITEISS